MLKLALAPACHCDLRQSTRDYNLNNTCSLLCNYACQLPINVPACVYRISFIFYSKMLMTFSENNLI